MSIEAGSARAELRYALGWRARVGFIIPQLDHLTEPMLARFLPDGITFHVSRMARTGPIDPDNMKQMNCHFETALSLLPLPYLDAIVYHCTMGSLFYGPAALLSDIKRHTSLPGVTTIAAATEALGHLEAKRIVLITPYQESFNEAERAYLKAEGIAVTATGGQPYVDSGALQHLSPEEVSLWVRRAKLADCDAVFISCTGVRSLEFIDHLEADLGIPVVTSFSAMLWQLLRTLNLDIAVPGLGQILAGRSA